MVQSPGSDLAALTVVSVHGSFCFLWGCELWLWNVCVSVDDTHTHTPVVMIKVPDVFVTNSNHCCPQGGAGNSFMLFVKIIRWFKGQQSHDPKSQRPQEKLISLIHTSTF